MAAVDGQQAYRRRTRRHEDQQPLMDLSNSTYGSASASVLSGRDGSHATSRSMALDLDRSRQFASVTAEHEKVTLSWHKINVVAPHVDQTHVEVPLHQKAIGALKRFTTDSRRRPQGATLSTLESGEGKYILRDANGVVPSGNLLAVMGASGAGKSTLMNVLTNRGDKKLKVTGKVLINGRPAAPLIKNVSAFVPQDDIFLGYLTVQEHLWFHASLRLPADYTDNDRKGRVNQVMLELNLVKCKNSLIGVPNKMKTLSGGERKRLAFASEALTNPSLLFCDEPTTGLDSFMAEAVVHSLKAMTRNGKTVVCTIHQPSSQVFKLFDNLLLMSEGRVAYFGNTDAGMKFLQDCGHVCPDDFNPADFVIHLLAIKSGQEIESRQSANAICDQFLESDAQKVLNERLQTIEGGNSDGASAKKHDRRRRQSQHAAFDSILESKSRKPDYMAQVKMVFWRTAKEYIRTPQVSRIRWLQCFFYGIFYGLMYLRQTYDQLGVFNLNGLIFELVALMVWENVAAVVYILPEEMPVIRRDYDTGVYDFSTYFVSRAIIEIPFVFVNTTTECVFIYWLSNMRPDAGAFVLFLLILFLTGICSKSVGYLLSSATDNLDILSTAIPAIIYPLSYVSGFYINIASIPPWLKWFQYLSFYYYANAALMLNQWTGVSDIICPYPSNDTRVDSCYRTGEDVIQFYSYQHSEFAWDISGILVLAIVMRVLAFLITNRKLKSKG